MRRGTMAPMASPTSARSAATGAGRRQRDRRPFWIAGLVMFGALILAGVASYETAPRGHRADTEGQLQEEGGAKPHIIPLPNSGHKPTNPGDRGGWEQFLTLGLIVGGLTGLG